MRVVSIAQDGPGQLWVAEDLVLDRNLVVLLVEPAEHLLQDGHLVRRIRLQLHQTPSIP